MHIPIILAHGAVGPLDEILPPVLLGGILGMIVLTWWNGRKAVPAAPEGANPADPADSPDSQAEPGLAVTADTDTATQSTPGVAVMQTAATVDDAHFPVS